MNALAIFFTVETIAAALLWAIDSVLLWVIGFIGFMICLPITAAAWIGYYYNKARLAKGKPKGNVLVFFAVLTGICLAVSVCYGLAYFTPNSKTDKFGYGFMMLYIISPILFFEFIGTLVAAIIKGKEQPQNIADFGAYVNPPYNSNMYQGYPNYQNYPNANNPYQNYPYQNGNYPNYPNYPDGNYPDYHNDPNGYYQNGQNNNFGGR